MADETPEQIASHRDHLKAENDRLNPEVDRLRAQADTLVQAHKDAKAETEAVRAERDRLAGERQAHAAVVADVETQLGRLREELAAATAAAARWKADYLALSRAATGAVKPLLDVLESVRARNAE